MSDIMNTTPRWCEAYDSLDRNELHEDNRCKMYEGFYNCFGFDFMESHYSLPEVIQNEIDMITNMKRNLKNLIKEEKVLSMEEYNDIIRVDKDDLKEFRDDICNLKKFRKGMAYIYMSDKYKYDDNPKKLLKDIWTERFKYTTIKKQADAVLNDKIETTPEQKKLIEEYEKNRQDKGLEQQIPLYLYRQGSGTSAMFGFCPVCYDITHHGFPEGRVPCCMSSYTKCKGWNPVNKKQHEVHNLLHGKDEYFQSPGNIIRHED